MATGSRAWQSLADRTKTRHLAFAGFLAVLALTFSSALQRIASLSVGDWRYSHIAVVPLASVSLIYLRRQRVFDRCKTSLGLGALSALAGVLVYWIGPDALWIAAAAVILVCAGGFIACYGERAFREGIFSFGVLLFAVPLPAPLLDGFGSALQKGSAEVTYVLLNAVGAPVLRNGLRFSLPGLEFEVAEECSGLRSAIALLITGVLAGYVMLRTGWARTCLALLTVPVAIVKNAVRIVTLSMLASYVDRGFIDGYLHHRGGWVFALVGLGLLAPVVLLLRSSEGRVRAGDIAVDEVRGRR